MGERIKHIIFLAIAIFCFFYFLPNFVLEEKKVKKVPIAYLLSLHSHGPAERMKSLIEAKLQEADIEVKKVNAEGKEGAFIQELQKLNKQDADLFISIGNQASQFLLKAEKKLPIMCVAANPERNLIDNYKGSVVGVIDDQIPPSFQPAFLKSLLPFVNKLAVVYDASNFPKEDITSFKQAAKKHDLLLQEVEVYRFSELYTLSRAIDNDAQGIFIFRDDLVMEGIDKVLHVGKKLKIPLIASDTYSVEKGAIAAWAVADDVLAIEASRLAVDYLKSGENASSQTVEWWKKHAKLWISKQALKKQFLKLEDVYISASKIGYDIQQLP
ncbi:MAG: hypothetical protein L7U87_03930 [Chlamydiales bacterium]|nr:hypothetical protein [Chlamydiales bacterium]